MKAVRVCDDLLAVDKAPIEYTEDLIGFLHDRAGIHDEDQPEFWSLRDGYRLFHNGVAEDCDVTPNDANDMAALESLPGPFLLVQVPGDPFTIGALIIGAALSAAAALFLRPKIPSIGKNNQAVESPNNSLSSRSNVARLGHRIADNYGEKWMSPDYIGKPYRVFEGVVEVEKAQFCIGRGSYAIEEADVLEDKTPYSEITDATVAIYGPYTSPNSGDPELTIGDYEVEPMLAVTPVNSVNGQTLDAPGLAVFEKNGKAWLDGVPGSGADGIFNPDKGDPRDYFEVSDTVIITNGDVKDASGNWRNIDGTYTITALTAHGIWLDDAQSVNSDWQYFFDTGSLISKSRPFTPTISGSGDANPEVVIPLYSRNDEDIIVNIVAQQGLYKVNSSAQTALVVDILFTVQPTDSEGTPTGSPEDFTITLTGSTLKQSQIGGTNIYTPSFSGPCTITAARQTERDTDFDGTISDAVKWRDLMLASTITQDDFGNVTTAFVNTTVNPTATAISERMFRVRGTRKVPSRDGDDFTEELSASKSIADIFCAIALDPHLGRRSLAELNVSQIYDTADAIQEYFALDEAAEFGYTFDDDQASAEDMLDAVAKACFCEPVRRGSVLELVFEKATPDSSIPLNHRNTLPQPRPKRTPRFGNLDNFDGVELTYADGDDYDARATIRIPEDGSATTPQKIDTIGVRNGDVASLIAYRAYNKILYQRWLEERTVTQEVAAITRLERVLIAPDNQPGIMTGDVEDQSGLTVTLDQKVTMLNTKNYLIHLQIPGGTVDTIAIEAGGDAVSVSGGVTCRTVTLAELPSSSLSVDIRNRGRSKYWIVTDDDTSAQAFLISEKGEERDGTYAITAVNYDDRYYGNDTDFVDGLLTYNAYRPNSPIAFLML